MIYQTYSPKPELAPFIKCFWILEVPEDLKSEKQLIVPDGCIEMAFILGEDIKRFTSESDYYLQPRSMVIGQTLEPFFIKPTGYVHTFAVRFYPHGFANFSDIPLKDLANRDSPLEVIFGDSKTAEISKQIISAQTTMERITIIEDFLILQLKEQKTLDRIVRQTVDSLLSSNGNIPIYRLLKHEISKRRQLERKFLKQIGISPKQLGRVIRLQAAIKILLSNDFETLTAIAYESDYYDQAHFIKDFKEFTGVTPHSFPGNDSMILSSLFYK